MCLSVSYYVRLTPSLTTAIIDEIDDLIDRPIRFLPRSNLSFHKIILDNKSSSREGKIIANVLERMILSLSCKLCDTKMRDRYFTIISDKDRLPSAPIISVYTNYILQRIFDFSSPIRIKFTFTVKLCFEQTTRQITSVVQHHWPHLIDWSFLFLTIIVDDLTLNGIIVVNLCSWWIKRKARWWGRRRDSTAAMCLHIRVAWQRCYPSACQRRASSAEDA